MDIKRKEENKFTPLNKSKNLTGVIGQKSTVIDKSILRSGCVEIGLSIISKLFQIDRNQ